MIDFGVKQADFNTSNILSFCTTSSSPYLPKSHPLSRPSYPICSPDHLPPPPPPVYFVTTSLLLRIRPFKEAYESFYIKERVWRCKYCRAIKIKKSLIMTLPGEHLMRSRRLWPYSLQLHDHELRLFGYSIWYQRSIYIRLVEGLIDTRFQLDAPRRCTYKRGDTCWRTDHILSRTLLEKGIR